MSPIRAEINKIHDFEDKLLAGIQAALFNEDDETLRADVIDEARANMAAEGLAIAAE